MTGCRWCGFVTSTRWSGRCPSCLIEGHAYEVEAPSPVTTTSTAFVKHDAEKVRLELLPFAALEEIAKVLAFGAKKYNENNWIKCESNTRYLGAALRHLFAWGRGEDKDKETGLSHLAHAGACVVFMIGLELDGKATDDRLKTGGAK